MNLGIGTVQFGLPYGISNTEGQPNAIEVKNILMLALQYGIKVIDTAHLYGSSEQVLGESFGDDNSFEIVTKTPSFSDNITSQDAIVLRETFFESLAKLQQKSVHGLLIHNSKHLLTAKSHFLWDEMVSLKEAGFIKKIGVSVYAPEELSLILDNFPIDIVQLPLNVFDQRFIQTGMLKRLHAMGIEIHVRSVFLQGLLLMDLEQVPQKFEPIKKSLMQYREHIFAEGLTPVQAALAFAYGIKEIDHIIIGITSVRQLQELIQAVSLVNQPSLAFDHFACFDERMINPSQWKFL